VVVAQSGVTLQSRSLKPLEPYFPNLAMHLSGLPAGTVLDGEVISFNTEVGRTSFTALQRRVTAGRALAREARIRPVTFVAFDLLHDADGDLRDQPLAQRRSQLEAMMAGAPTALQLCQQTTDYDEALLWLEAYAPLGCEGLVVKDLSGRYRRTGWWKHKIRNTVEAIIGGVTGTLGTPSALLLGRRDGRGRLRYVGHTGPLTVPQQQEVTELVTPLAPGGRHPWPQPLPPGWIGLTDIDTLRAIAPSEESLPSLLMITQAEQAVASNRARITFGLSQDMNVTTVVLGHWTYGSTLSISEHGDVHPEPG
jgi:ATP-dependent DNA ligase